MSPKKNQPMKVFIQKPVMVVHTFNRSSHVAETSESLCVQGQTVLHSTFHDSYVERPCLKNSKNIIN